MPTKYQTTRASGKAGHASGTAKSAKRPAAKYAKRPATGSKLSAASKLTHSSKAKPVQLDTLQTIEQAGQGITLQQAHDRMLKHLDESFRRLA